MQLIYGTGNSAKVQYMRSLLSTLDVEIIGIKELGVKLSDIGESGNNPLENAVIKAKAYYAALRKPVFSADSGLYFEEAPPELQSGVHVRRVKGKNLSDVERQAKNYGKLKTIAKNHKKECTNKV